jgi:hypothetical protein
MTVMIAVSYLRWPEQRRAVLLGFQLYGAGVFSIFHLRWFYLQSCHAAFSWATVQLSTATPQEQCPVLSVPSSLLLLDLSTRVLQLLLLYIVGVPTVMARWTFV